MEKGKIVELDFHSFSIVFPQFIHTLNTLWNTLVFSSGIAQNRKLIFAELDELSRPVAQDRCFSRANNSR